MALQRNGGLHALTSLQIGDIQSYVSRLFLLVACEGLKLVFLVDNGPWTVNSRPSRPAELWQLLVNKSRGSPFANRLRDYTEGDVSSERGFLGRESSDSRAAAGQEKEDGWLSLLFALQRSCRERARVKKPQHGLYGCVAFEVAWSDVRGINYSNELQTDTCVSLEVKVMTKREFDSIEQARACYDTILSGSKDGNPSPSVPNILGGKSVGTLVRCKGPVNKLQGFARARAEAPKMHLDDSVGVVPSSGAVERKQIRTRQLVDTARSYTYVSRATLIIELSRAYFSSLTSRFGTRLDPVNAGCLPPEYFTPPSSPYSEQVLHNLFKNYSSHQLKDTKKFRIVPFDEDLEELQSVSERRILNLKRAGEHTSSVGSEGVDIIRASHDRKDLSGVSHESFDKARSLGCSRCRVMGEGTPFWERSPECVRCSASTEVRPDPVYVHPDRLIAPAETYRDILLMFKFSDPFLPVELRQIITADRRLLKMLESGLPPWVIFLQSYPILCHVYRPWMRPLCGTIYYLISIVTVLIGFYDLYKNVPVLKATAAHICGPLFEWIEEWGMVSRLKYLGTMLFLQNWEKAFEWALAVTRASRQVSMLLMRPILEPLMSFGEILLPLWVGVSSGVQTMVQFMSASFYSVFLSLSGILSIIIWPFMTFLSTLQNLGKALLYPVFSAIWTFLSLPIQLLRLVGSLLVGLSFEVMNGLQNLWLAIYNTLQLLLTSGSPALQSFQIVKSTTPAPSMWRSLWNDILSKVFHALNGIVKGLAAFITACNRHRLSIYNQAVEFLFRASHMLKSGYYVALSTWRKIFLLPDSSEVVPAVGMDEVEQEPKRIELSRFCSELPSSLRHRPKEGTSAALLSMQGQFSSIPNDQH